MISDISKPILFADSTSIIITNSNPSEIKKKNINSVFIKINSWFKSNLLSLNFDKTHFLQLITKIIRKFKCKCFMKINELIILIILNFSD
jgi:hypothetical protein